MIISQKPGSTLRDHALDGKSAYHRLPSPTHPYNAAAMTAEKGGYVYQDIDRKRRMSSALQDVLSILDLETLEVNLFRGRSPQSRWQRVFGGQVIGQALVAACRTVEDVAARPPHSLHAYFLLA